MKKLALTFFLFIPLLNQAQSEVGADLRSTYGEMSVRYLSESIIRAVINYVDTTGSLAEMGTDLDQIVFFTRTLDEESIQTLEKRMTNLSEQAGYEEMMTVKNKDVDATLLGLGELGGSEGVIILMRPDEESIMFVEVVGSVNLSYFLNMFTQGGGENLGTQLGDMQKLLDFDLGF